MRRLLLVAALPLLAPAAAQADVNYAGTAVRGTRPIAPLLSLVRRDDGTVRARFGSIFSCRNRTTFNITTRLDGRMNGDAFTATGKTKLRSGVRLRYTLTGTLTADGGTGKIRLRAGRCKGYTRSVIFRTESVPAGAPAVPAPNSLLLGFGAQSASGTRVPVVMRVANNGRVYAVWGITLSCGRSHISRVDQTPTRKVNADGTFGGSQTYRIRYSDGTAERYRVRFSGRFVTDGAVGTMRMTVTSKGFKPCRSGTVTWAAR